VCNPVAVLPGNALGKMQEASSKPCAQTRGFFCVQTVDFRALFQPDAPRGAIRRTRLRGNALIKMQLL